MLSMLKDSALSDVCLVVEGIDVPSHKAVLGELILTTYCVYFVSLSALLVASLL